MHTYIHINSRHMYMYVRTYMYRHTFKKPPHTQIHTDTHPHTQTHTLTHTDTHTLTHRYTHPHTQIHTPSHTTDAHTDIGTHFTYLSMYLFSHYIVSTTLVFIGSILVLSLAL